MNQPIIPKPIKIALCILMLLLPLFIKTAGTLGIVLQGHSAIATVTYSKKMTVRNSETGDSHYNEVRVSYTTENGITYDNILLGRYIGGKSIGKQIKIFYDGKNPMKITDGIPIKGTEGSLMILWCALWIFFLSKSIMGFKKEEIL